MVTNKKQLWRQVQFILMTAVIACFAGCKPAGPRALLEGKQLIEQGKYADAIQELKRATSLLSTNAHAWNYLGLAYHHAGDAPDALEAYQRALKWNEDLVIVHYNLGCLLLEQNTPDSLENAKNEFTAFTLHQRNSAEGWQKLGVAQLRLGELPGADASFREALRLNSQDTESMNDLGVIQLQKKRLRDAALCFNNALKLQPNYGPAILNLAVTDIYQGSRSAALQKYRDYLDLSPRPANWDAVNAVANQLDQELNPAPRPPTNAIPIVVNQNTNVARIETPTNITRPPAIVTAPKPPPVEPVTTPEVVRMPDTMPLKVAEGNVPSTPTPKPPVASSEVIGEPPVEPATNPATTPAKRGFFQRINPISLFHHDTTKPATNRPAVIAMVPPSITSNRTPPTLTDTNETPKPAPPPKTITVPRYPYLQTSAPVAGNRTQAEQLTGQGGDAQRDHRSKDAQAFYRAASQADPSYFDAFIGLGSAASTLGDTPEACRAYELALGIKPDSFDARFNFGLALKRANYIVDAAQELERLLASSVGKESPAHIALVHLTLGNLYAEEFHQPASARPHYLKVLALDPQNSQATTIRYWLQNNP